MSRLHCVLLSTACIITLLTADHASGQDFVVGARPIRRADFNLRFDLDAGENGQAELYFHADAHLNGYRVLITNGTLTLQKQQDGKASDLASGRLARSGKQALIVKRRGAAISIYAGGRRILSANDDSFRSGAFAWRSTGDVYLADGILQDIGDIYFADGFMREVRGTRSTTTRVQSHGQWRAESGEWNILAPGTTEKSAAIFQLCANSTDNQRAIYRTGYWFWDNYLFAASVRPATTDDLVGMRIYDFDDDNHLLLEWGGEQSGIRLVRVDAGARAQIGESAGAFVPGQWYRIKLLLLDQTLRVYLDDNLLMNVEVPGVSCGGIALEALGTDVRFDDVLVFDIDIETEQFADDASPALHNILRNAEGRESTTDIFAARPTMRAWSTDEGSWYSIDGVEWNDGVYYDGRFQWTAGTESQRGTVAMLMSDDAGNLDRGYRAVASFDAGEAWSVVEVFRDGIRLDVTQRSDAPPQSMVFNVSQRSLQIIVDSSTILDEKLPENYNGVSFGRYTSGAVGKHFAVESTKLLDYTFTRAPSDWFTIGQWDLHPRWTCDPSFNWFGGQNRNGSAILWNKHEFSGDYTVEAFFACMLLGNFPRDYLSPINFRVTLGADAMQPDRGYTGIYGYVDRPAEILRNGVVVASDDSEVDATLWRDFEHARSEHVHRRWFNLKLEKRGNEIRFYVDRKLRLIYTDDDPLDGRFISISTENNGIMVSKVRITYEDCSGKSLITR